MNLCTINAEKRQREPELKKCPFCGGDAILDELPSGPFSSEQDTFEIGCMACNIGWYKDTKEEAIKTWNRRADGWISVSERLPEHEQDVLVHFDDGFIATVTYADDWELWSDAGEPTHWMPLPQPPKE